MKNQKWIFDAGNCRIVVEDDSSNVLYTDSDEDLIHVPGQVYENICITHNQFLQYESEFSGKDRRTSMEAVDKYLLDEELCTQDARELIMEELYDNYYNLL